MKLPEGWTVESACKETGEPKWLVYIDTEAPDPEADDVYSISLEMCATPDRSGNATYTWYANDSLPLPKGKEKEWPEGTTLETIFKELESWY